MCLLDCFFSWLGGRGSDAAVIASASLGVGAAEHAFIAGTSAQFLRTGVRECHG